MHPFLNLVLPIALGFVFCGYPPFPPIIVINGGGNTSWDPLDPPTKCIWCNRVAGMFGAAALTTAAGSLYGAGGLLTTVVLSIAGGLAAGTLSHTVMGTLARN